MSSQSLTHASLFSGIGGFDLAAEWAGMTNVFNCDFDSYCRHILKHHFPNATQYADIRTTDFTRHRGDIDVLTGGFPCQPFSMAGKRRGTDDDRYLWPEMLRAIREIRPSWVVGENVLGIISWSEGLVFEQVCADLEAEGYEVQPYVLPACGVDAPHRRFRTWFVGHLVENPERVRRDGDESEEESRTGRFGKSCAGDHVRVCGTKRVITHRADAGIETMREGQEGVHAAGIVADTKCFGGREIHDQIQSEQPNGSGINCDGSERNASDTSCLEDIGWRQGGFLSQPAGVVATGIITDSCDPRLEGSDESRCCESGERLQVRRYLAGCGDEIITHTESERLSERDAEPGRDRTYAATQRHDGIPGWDDFPTQPPVCGGDDGLSERLDPAAVFAGLPERLRKRRNHVVRWRTEAIKCYGNAIVPQVVYRIFLTILQYERCWRRVEPTLKL